jgi:hypothetical protein
VADNVTDLARDAVAFTDLATRDAQLAAITAWGTGRVEAESAGQHHTSGLRGAQRPPADLPDADHGFLDQWAELFADHVGAFLNG